MSNKVKQCIRVNKKNDGQEIHLEFTYFSTKDISYPEKIAVETWVKQYGTNMLHLFKMEFPGLVQR